MDSFNGWPQCRNSNNVCNLSLKLRRGQRTANDHEQVSLVPFVQSTKGRVVDGWCAVLGINEDKTVAHLQMNVKEGSVVVVWIWDGGIALFALSSVHITSSFCYRNTPWTTYKKDQENWVGVTRMKLLGILDNNNQKSTLASITGASFTASSSFFGAEFLQGTSLLFRGTPEKCNFGLGVKRGKNRFVLPYMPLSGATETLNH